MEDEIAVTLLHDDDRRETLDRKEVRTERVFA